jgi:hypothetical protein
VAQPSTISALSVWQIKGRLVEGNQATAEKYCFECSAAAKLLGGRDGRRNCKDLKGRRQYGTWLSISNLASGRQRQRLLAELDDVEAYRLSRRPAKPSFRQFNATRSQSQKPSPRDVWRGRIPADDLIRARCSMNRPRLSSSKGIYAIHNGTTSRQASGTDAIAPSRF